MSIGFSAMFDCVDCGKSTLDLGEYYMVTDALWAKAGMAPEGGMLCIGDLERRLKRTLNKADFTNVPVNDPAVAFNPMSDRLLDRLLTD